MNLKKLIFTNNACYKTNKTITPRGIMVHSTGSNNPWLRRYVGPDDGHLGRNNNNNHWNQKMDRNVCVHAFIGKLANGSIATYQTLPWNHLAWHSGSGAKGSANNTHISFEICEDNLTDREYFLSVYKEAVELCAMLCETYSIDPSKAANGMGIVDHREGRQSGLASNHGDVGHWFPRHGKSMDTFRADVTKQIKEKSDMAIMEEIRKIQGLQNTTDKEVAEILAYILKNKNVPTAPATKAEFDKAVSRGISDGSSPGMPMARWQGAIMTHRATSK